MLAAIFLMVALAHGPAPFQAKHEPIDATDSISVLLFASLSADTLVVTAPGSKPATISIGRDSGLRRDRDRVNRAAFASNRLQPLVLQERGTRRRTFGTVAVVAREGHLAVIARMSIGDYLAGTLAAETNSQDPYEYLVALAVVQRNYALTHRGRHSPYADVCDNTHCQRTNAGTATPRLRSIVLRAESVQTPLHPAYYSVNCGGETLTPEDVWGQSEGSYSRVRCRYCSSSRWRHWGRTIAASRAVNSLLARHPPCPFVDEGLKIALGRRAGFAVVPSNTFDRIERRAGTWRVFGRGFGHRVGLCQEGACALALQGKTARQILDFYFPTFPPTQRP